MTRHEVKKLSVIARQVMQRKELHLLKKWMLLNKMTSKALARLSGISASGIRGICRYKDPSKRSCIKLSQATGIPPEVLMFPDRFKECPPVSPRLRGDYGG